MVWASMRSASPLWVFAGFCASFVGLPLWVAAWGLLIPASRRPSVLALFEAQSVTLAAIQAFSVLGGGATAVFMLVRRAGLSASGAVSLLAFDQLLTGVVKLILIAAAIAFAPAPVLMRTVGLTLLVLVMGLLGLVLVIAHSETATRRRAIDHGGWRGKVFFLAAELAGNLAAIRSPVRFSGALLLYLLRRSAEGFTALCIQMACGQPVSGEAALLIVAVLAVATMIPGPPGNLGVYEAVVSLAYLACGYSSESAVAMALLQHVAFLAAACVPGLVLVLIRPPWRRIATP
jgi:uncharacterized membrane protein YbhN (UPF0104 family)